MLGSRTLRTFARAFATRPLAPKVRSSVLVASLVALVSSTLYLWLGPAIRSDAQIGPAVSLAEVTKHKSLEDCWISIDGHVYDVSKLLAEHPGGAARILQYAGGDATRAFGKIHTPLVLKKMKEHITYLGPLAENELVVNTVVEPKLELDPIAEAKPPLAQMFNILDFEYVAKHVLPQTTFTYYATGASDEFSLRENHYAYLRVFFKPKVLRNVSNVTTATLMLGVDAELPLYISGFAGSHLAHPDAEWNLQRGAYREKIVQMVPKQISIDMDEFFAGVPADQQQWAQHHFYSDRELENVDQLLEKFHLVPNLKAIFFNVDVVDLGNREKDTKMRAMDDEMLDLLTECSNNHHAVYCKSFSWDHIKKIVGLSRLPIGLKGVQRGEDVVLAAQHGVKAVVLSNHGGRQLDFSRPPLEVLVEARQMLKEKGLENDIEIYVDGGIRRGSDIVKALCLGAKGVGLGRPFLYAMAGYGEEGVVRAIQILKKEVKNNMTLLGANSIAELDESFVDPLSLKLRNPNITDRQYDSNYVPLSSPPWGT